GSGIRALRWACIWWRSRPPHTRALATTVATSPSPRHLGMARRLKFMLDPTPRACTFAVSQSVVVHALFDGGLAGTLDDSHNMPADDVRKILLAAGQESPPRPDLTCFLIEDGSARILVDAGAGTGLGPGAGALIESLALIGLEPFDIDAVVLTHLHG